LIASWYQIIVAERDELIPRDSTLALWRAFPPGAARIRIIARASHNSISERPGYLQALQEGP
jgi:pimeloyl-ACP methyl ester carboxylesterase